MKPYEKYKESGVEWIGEIPEHWVVSKIRYCSTSVKTGKTPPTENESYFGEGQINWFGPGDFKTLFLRDSSRTITEKAVNELKLELYPEGTVLLIGIGATLGKVGIINAPSYSNQQVNAIIFNSYINPQYGLFFLDVFKEITTNEASSSTMAILNQSKTKDLLLLIPPLAEQTAIANFLDHQTAIIDELIEKKTKQIALLKEKRQAIINETVTKGLDPTAKVKDSGVEWLGEIPESWEVVKLKSLLMSGNILQQDGNHGELHPTASDYVDEGIPFIMASNVNYGKIDFKTCKFIAKEITDKLRIGFSIEGDVLLTHKGTVGRVAVVPTLNTPYIMLTPQVTYYRVISNKLLNTFLAYVFETNFFQMQLSVFGSEGSTRNYVGLLNQKELRIIIPNEETQKKIVLYLNDFIEKYDNLISLTNNQIEKLKEYRQSLISEAVTGKIDVRGWE